MALLPLTQVVKVETKDLHPNLVAKMVTFKSFKTTQELVETVETVVMDHIGRNF